MSALAEASVESVWESIPTGAIYRLPIAGETGVEPVPGIDSHALIGRLHGDAAEPTATTFRRGEPSIRYGRAGTLGALIGTGLVLVSAPIVFEPTPFTITAGVARTAAATAAGHAAAAPAAYRAFKDLGRWLDAEDGQIADMVGIGRTTPYTWKREGREPRAATTQRIYEYHASLDSLQRRLGPEGLRAWLHEGMPPRRDTVLQGQLQALERAVYEVLFRPSLQRRADLAAAPEDAAPAAAVENPATILPSGRRPRRPRR